MTAILDEQKVAVYSAAKAAGTVDLTSCLGAQVLARPCCRFLCPYTIGKPGNRALLGRDADSDMSAVNLTYSLNSPHIGPIGACHAMASQEAQTQLEHTPKS